MVAYSRPTTTTLIGCFPLSTPMQPTFSLNCDTTLMQNAFYITFREKYERKPSRTCVIRFVANKGLIQTMMITSRINLMAQAILLRTKLCKMYRVYCLNYILTVAELRSTKNARCTITIRFVYEYATLYLQHAIPYVRMLRRIYDPKRVSSINYTIFPR